MLNMVGSSARKCTGRPSLFITGVTARYVLRAISTLVAIDAAPFTVWNQ